MIFPSKWRSIIFCAFVISAAKFRLNLASPQAGRAPDAARDAPPPPPVSDAVDGIARTPAGIYDKSLNERENLSRASDFAPANTHADIGEEGRENHRRESDDFGQSDGQDFAGNKTPDRFGFGNDSDRSEVVVSKPESSRSEAATNKSSDKSSASVALARASEKPSERGEADVDFAEESFGRAHESPKLTKDGSELHSDKGENKLQKPNAECYWLG